MLEGILICQATIFVEIIDRDFNRNRHECSALSSRSSIFLPSIFAVSVSLKSLRVSLSVCTGTTRSEGRWLAVQTLLLRFDGSSSSIWWFERFDGLSEKYSWIFVASWHNRFWLKGILETSPSREFQFCWPVNPKFRNHCSVYFERWWFWSADQNRREWDGQTY